MVFITTFLLSIGCIVCGIITTSSIILKKMPVLKGIVYSIIRYKIVIGLATLITAIVTLFFPGNGYIIIGSFFPAASGLLIGILLCLEYFINSKIIIINRMVMVWFGNVLIFFKIPLGLISLFFGFLHIFYADVLFL
jgi:hypothetical protein